MGSGAKLGAPSLKRKIWWSSKLFEYPFGRQAWRPLIEATSSLSETGSFTWFGRQAWRPLIEATICRFCQPNNLSSGAKLGAPSLKHPPKSQPGYSSPGSGAKLGAPSLKLVSVGAPKSNRRCSGAKLGAPSLKRSSGILWPTRSSRSGAKLGAPSLKPLCVVRLSGAER